MLAKLHAFARARHVLERAGMRAALVLALLLPAGQAVAAPDRCARTQTDLAFDGTDLAEMSGDTGWFPSGYAAQLRITGRVVGKTRVGLGLAPTACWDGPMTTTLPMREGSGSLDVAYGAELHLYGHIDTTVLGEHIFWEHEIPIPYIPEDLIIAGTTAFDPAFGTSAEVHDTTHPVKLIKTDVLSDIISITGISGNLHVDVTGAMTTSFEPTALVSRDDRLTSATDALASARPDGGWGSSLDVPVAAEGVVHYQPQLIFSVGADLSILGVRVVSFTLFDVPMSLPAFDRPVTLTGDAARIPLPVLADVGDGARLDFAAGLTQELPVTNAGKGPLVLEVTSAPPGIVVPPVSLAPGAHGTLRVSASDGALATGTTVPLVLATNDPDHPTLEVALGIDVGGTDPGETGEAGGCSAGGAPGPLMMVALALLVARRRRSAHVGPTA